MICDYDLVELWLKFVWDYPGPIYHDTNVADHVLAFLLSADNKFVRVVPAIWQEHGIDLEYSTLCPVILQPVTWSPGTNSDARRFKKRFRQYHRRADWFRCDGELLGWLRRQVRRHGGWVATNAIERAADLNRVLGNARVVDPHWVFVRDSFFPHRRELDARSRHCPMVYFLLARECDRLKIGTSESIFERFKLLQDRSPCLLEFLGTAAGGQDLEARIHRALCQFRDHGEWFHWNATMERAVGQIMRDGTIPQLGVSRILGSG